MNAPVLNVVPKFTDGSSTNFITGVVRLSYCQLFTPKAGPQGGKEKYSTAVLIPKTDTATIEIIRKARKAAMQAKWPGKTDEQLKLIAQRSGFKPGLRDGDADRSDDPAYAGHYFFNASSERKPQLLDARLNPITDPNDLRSGDYARVNVNAYGYEKNGGIGVAFGLNNVQMLARGPALSGGPDAVDVFDAVEGAPAAAGAVVGSSDPNDFL